MACERTKLKRYNNPWLDDIDELELKFKQKRKDDSKVESRKTWNSRCGTDFGVFEQVTNDKDKAVENSGAIAMTEDISVTMTISNRDSIENLKNTMPSNNLANSGNVNQILACTSNAVDKETSLCDEDQILNERGSADNSSNVGQGSQIVEAQEMEIQIIKEKLVNLPATVDVKQENSLDEEEEIQIIQEKLVKVPATVHFKQQNSSDEEEDIQIIQENLVETPSISNIKREKSFYQPKVTFTLVNGNLETVSQATHQRDLKNGQIRIRKDIQITSVRKQPVGTTESPVKANHLPGLEFLTSLKQPAGISKHPVHCELLEVPIHDENSPVSNGSEEVSGPIHDKTTRGNSPVNNENEEVSGPLHDGTTQGNSPVNNENEEVTVVLHDGAIDLDFENQERDLFDIIEDRAFKGKQIPSASNVSRNSLPQEYHGPVEKEIFMEVDNGDFENGQSIHDRRLTSMLPSESDTEVASMSIPSQLECSKSSKNHVELSNDEEDVEDEVEKQIELVPKIKIKRNLIQWAFEFDSDSILTPPRKTSKRGNSPVSNESEVTGPIHDENSSVSNGSKEVSGPIHDKTTRGNSPVNNENEEVSGPLHDATTQGNSPVNNENEEVTVVLHDGAIGQKTGSQRNLTIKLGTGDVTVTDGGRTVQMKMSDGSISGQADDVVNLVKTLKQVVCDL